MNSIKSRPDKASEFNLLIHGTKLAETVTNLFAISNTISKRGTSVDIILLERRWTDVMKELLDFGNAFILQNFELCLILEDKDKS